jgi:transcription elongation factor Elf1
MRGRKLVRDKRRKVTKPRPQPLEVDCPGIGKTRTGTVDKSSGREKGYCPDCKNLEPVECVAGEWVMEWHTAPRKKKTKHPLAGQTSHGRNGRR